jgi:hypothetical protein
LILLSILYGVKLVSVCCIVGLGFKC